MTATVGTVRSVDRALDILLCFAKANGELSLSQLARLTGLHKSTTHRLLSSLLEKGFVRKHAESERYTLGWSVLELIGSLYQSDQLSAVTLPEMTHLRDEIGETVSLYIRSGNERIRIQAVESTESIRNVAIVGKTYPLCVGASGKVLLAFSEPSTTEEVLRQAEPPLTVNLATLRKELEQIRTQGYATSIQERDPAAAALAVPVFGRAGVIAALSISGPFSRFSSKKMEACLPLLLGSAKHIMQLITH